MNIRRAHAAQSDEVEELAEQLHDLPPLRPAEADALLADLRANGTQAARERLVESNLAIALEEARQRGDRGVQVSDLYQEATLAIIAAVHEYVLRDAPAAGLPDFARRVVAQHLDETVEAAELEQRGEEAFVRDAQLFEVAEVGLRRRLGRAATATELASLLEWPPERVETMAGMLGAARAMYDDDIALYLDDDE